MRTERTLAWPRSPTKIAVSAGGACTEQDDGRQLKLMITEAERRFPVRVRVGVPATGLGQRLNEMQAWLDENCGANGWAMTPAGMRGVVNDALAIYFLDATLASAFVARWCAGYKIETAEGVFRVRDDAPEKRVPAPMHGVP